MEHRLLWGDLHNHSEVGLFHYAKGSLARSIDIARSHLDFFAFTGHAQWHDMPEMPGGAREKWVAGFKKHEELWGKTRSMIAEANLPGRFVALLGYEWHSAAFGDRSVLYPHDDGELFFTDEAAKLQRHAERTGAILVPHHIGYKPGLPGRGTNWDYVDESVSPVVEIFSEHGAAERDRGPFAYIRHSNGPRTTAQTLQHALARGLHLGVVASTDDHLGYPGAYGEGLAAVYATDLSREGIFSALRQRRCYGVTGDRIELDFRINEQCMGQVLPATNDRTVAVGVRGWDEIESVELIRNGLVVHRHFPEQMSGGVSSGRWKCRIEYGWGPWTALGMARTADWQMSLGVRAGTILAAMPCFQSGPFDEDRRNRILKQDGSVCAWQSYTGREGSFAETPTNAVVVEMEGDEQTVVELELEKPVRMAWSMKVAELADESRIEFVGPFPSESLLVHRLVPERLYTAEFEITDRGSGERDEDYYYVRVRQVNGQMAWSSPIWVGCAP